MRAIIITEKRLVELFELTLARLQNAEVGKVGSDVVVPHRSIVFSLETLKSEIRDGAL
jgi:hypothetical protein